MTALVIAGLTLIAVLAVSAAPLSRLPYFLPHAYYRASEEREVSHDPHGGGRG